MNSHKITRAWQIKELLKAFTLTLPSQEAVWSSACEWAPEMICLRNENNSNNNIRPKALCFRFRNRQGLPRRSRLRTSTEGNTGSIPVQETKVPHAARCSQRKKREREIDNDVCIYLYTCMRYIHMLCIWIHMDMYICMHMHTRVHIRYSPQMRVCIYVWAWACDMCAQKCSQMHTCRHTARVCLHSCLCAHTRTSTKGEASRWAFCEGHIRILLNPVPFFCKINPTNSWTVRHSTQNMVDCRGFWRNF